MIVKCFGGRHDNRRVYVNDDMKLGDHWQLPVQLPLTVLDSLTVLDFNDPAPISTEIELEEYVLEALRTSNIEVKFLRHTTLSLETILLKLFK